MIPRPRSGMQLRNADFRFKKCFDLQIRRKSAVRSRILFASTVVMYRPRFDSDDQKERRLEELC